MKILKRNIITVRQAEELIEKYYDGRTTNAEEKLLRAFLSQKDCPEQFFAEKAIFGYFENQKADKKHVRMPKYLRWSAAAAISALVIISAAVFTNRPSAGNYAYVDGIKTTNKKVIRTLAQSTVANIATGTDEVETGLENIRQNNVIDDQLDVFSGIEF